MKLPFKPLKQVDKDIKFYAFDIETANDNKDFVCGGIYSKDYKKQFLTKESMINEMLFNDKYLNCVFVATNLGFDWCGLFFENNKDIFRICKRNSNFIHCKTYRRKNGTTLHNKPNPRKKQKKYDNLSSITFIDTANFAQISVQQLGEIVGIKKLNSPKALGRVPVNSDEWEELLKYNLQDCKVSYYAMELFHTTIVGQGGTFKDTIASCSLSIFRNRFLKDTFWRHDTEICMDQFKGYYGGNTHAYKRGRFKNYFLYDIVSMYPSEMRKIYPNPNTLSKNKYNTTEYIEQYEGMSEVSVSCPKMEYPFLSHKSEDGRLFCPTGTWKGWYCHHELRYATELGYTILKVHNCHWYKETMYPFAEFVDTLYEIRKKYKRENNPMHFVIKLIMNSLYGKFAQKFTDVPELKHESEVDIDFLNKNPDYTAKGDYYVFKTNTEPKAFSFIIWSAYTTAYARIKLHKLIVKYEAVYCDTDSIMCKKEIVSNSDLGGLELKEIVKEAIIVKAKFYLINSTPRVKGVPRLKGSSEFITLIKSKKWKYEHIVKFSEAITRDLIPNQVIEVVKHFDLEDTKRVWDKPFSMYEEQSSIPIELDNGVPTNINTNTHQPTNNGTDKRRLNRSIKTQI